MTPTCRFQIQPRTDGIAIARATNQPEANPVAPAGSPGGVFEETRLRINVHDCRIHMSIIVDVTKSAAPTGLDFAHGVVGEKAYFDKTAGSLVLEDLVSLAVRRFASEIHLWIDVPISNK